MEAAEKTDALVAQAVQGRVEQKRKARKELKKLAKFWKEEEEAAAKGDQERATVEDLLKRTKEVVASVMANVPEDLLPHMPAGLSRVAYMRGPWWAVGALLRHIEQDIITHTKSQQRDAAANGARLLKVLNTLKSDYGAAKIDAANQ